MPISGILLTIVGVVLFVTGTQAIGIICFVLGLGLIGYAIVQRNQGSGSESDPGGAA